MIERLTAPPAPGQPLAALHALRSVTGRIPVQGRLHCSPVLADSHVAQWTNGADGTSHPQPLITAYVGLDAIANLA